MPPANTMPSVKIKKKSAVTIHLAENSQKPRFGSLYHIKNPGQLRNVNMVVEADGAL